MKLEKWHASDDKKRWKVVRLDSYQDVPGDIEAADEDTGECALLQADGNGGTVTKTISFGPNGLRIVSRRR